MGIFSYSQRGKNNLNLLEDILEFLLWLVPLGTKPHRRFPCLI